MQTMQGARSSWAGRKCVRERYIELVEPVAEVGLIWKLTVLLEIQSLPYTSINERDADSLPLS